MPYEIDVAATALTISVLSMCMAGAAVFWSVYRDVGLRPRVKVSLSIRRIIGNGQVSEELLTIIATNHGPGPIRLEMIVFRQKKWWHGLARNFVGGIINQDHTNPNSGQLPKNLEPGGEPLILLLPFPGGLRDIPDVTHIGLSDSYGRNLWAARQSLREVKKAALDFRTPDSAAD